jgi:hypothetical protein
MSSESSESLPIVARPLEERVQPPTDLALVPGQDLPAPSEEQVRVADAAFAHKPTESETVAGIMGMWTGGMLLKDLLQDALKPPTDEDEEEKKKRLPKSVE